MALCSDQELSVQFEQVPQKRNVRKLGSSINTSWYPQICMFDLRVLYLYSQFKKKKVSTKIGRSLVRSTTIRLA